MSLPIAVPREVEGAQALQTRLKITPTGLVLYQDCPRAYKHKEVDRLKTKKQSVNLPFGTALHSAFETSISCLHRGVSVNPIEIFKASFETEIAGKEIEYPNHFDKDSTVEMGMKLAERFHEIWPTLGLVPLEDDQGNLLMEKRMEFMLPDNILLVGKMDLPVLDKAGQLIILDLKTARSEADPSFLNVSDQLTAYQVLVDGNLEILGNPGQVSRLGFLEAIKRKVSPKGQGPTVEPPKTIQRRSDEEIAAWIDKVRWTAAQIRAKAFHRTARMAYNSPCDMCDFRLYCHTGKKDDLVEREVFGIAPPPSHTPVQPIQVVAREKRAIPSVWF